MILAVAATQMEMAPLLRELDGDVTGCQSLVSGVGCVETTLQLTRCLSRLAGRIDGVLNFGVAGAYIQPPGQIQPKILDLCLADREILGDFGIVFPERLEPMPQELTGEIAFAADPELTGHCGALLGREGIVVHRGTFVTVQSVSGSKARGEILRKTHLGLCEEMEGAAVGRVCGEFHLPFAALRCISNLVEDRNRASWRLRESCEIAGSCAAKIINNLKS